MGGASKVSPSPDSTRGTVLGDLASDKENGESGDSFHPNKIVTFTFLTETSLVV